MVPHTIIRPITIVFGIGTGRSILVAGVGSTRRFAGRIGTTPGIRTMHRIITTTNLYIRVA